MLIKEAVDAMEVEARIAKQRAKMRAARAEPSTSGKPPDTDVKLAQKREAGASEKPRANFGRVKAPLEFQDFLPPAHPVHFYAQQRQRRVCIELPRIFANFGICTAAAVSGSLPIRPSLSSLASPCRVLAIAPGAPVPARAQERTAFRRRRRLRGSRRRRRR